MSPQPHRFPGFAQSIGLIILVVALGTAWQLIFYIAGGDPFAEGVTGWRPVLTVWGLHLAILVVVAGWLWGRKLSLAEAFPSPALPSEQHRPFALSLLGSWLAIVGLLGLLDWIFPGLADIGVEALDAVFDAQPWWNLVFWGAIVVPVLEEVLFRGLILQGLRERHGAQRALIVSSVLFGLVHFENPLRVLMATLVGLVLGWWFLRTGSLWPAIAGHVAINFSGIGFELLGIVDGAEELLGTGRDPGNLATSLVMLALGGAVARNGFREAGPLPPDPEPPPLPETADAG